jgi:hypothetical protein
MDKQYEENVAVYWLEKGKNQQERLEKEKILDEFMKNCTLK